MKTRLFRMKFMRFKQIFRHEVNLNDQQIKIPYFSTQKITYFFVGTKVRFPP